MRFARAMESQRAALIQMLMSATNDQQVWPNGDPIEELAIFKVTFWCDNCPRRIQWLDVLTVISYRHRVARCTHSIDPARARAQ